ncbi:MAG: cytochrome biosynthesis protein [Bacillales bacterium]|nr:cytochrome biosynthesis protein [Bacillales bacterium]
MFEIFTPIFDWFGKPFWDLSQQFQTSTFFYSFFLGLYCAFLQGQLIWNISAIAFFSKEATEKIKTMYLFLCFLLGKMFMYSVFTAIIWTSGRPPQSVMLDYFPSINLFYGISLIIVGFISFGILKIPFLEKWKCKVPSFLNNIYTETFILGIIFSFSFGDRVMTIFVDDIMNMILTSSIGSAIPSIFAIGTVTPILIMLLLLFILVRFKVISGLIAKFHSSIMKFVAIFMIVTGFYELLL